MDALLEVIASLFAAFTGRGERRPSLGRVLREALAQRVAPSSPPAAAPGPIPSPAPTMPSLPVSTLAVPAATVVRPRPGEPADPAAEVRLVTGLFASPQSLVAAFIVAEVLAKPVALRDR